MQNDLKIGMMIGLMMIAVAAIFIATDPNLSTKARLIKTQNLNLPSDSPNTLANLQSPSPLPNEKEIKSQRFHVVDKDETLSSISYKYYGSINEWRKIMNANRDILKDEKSLKPNMKLLIPE